MADHQDISVLDTNWVRVAAVTDRVRWQARGAAVSLSTKTTPTGDTGIYLCPGEVLDISAGLLVWYRGHGSAAQLVREVL